jgi:hypothetical protein
MKKTNHQQPAAAPHSPQRPPAAPQGFALSGAERAEFALLQAESNLIVLRRENLILRMANRVGHPLDGWHLDLQRGLCTPPQMPVPEQESK